MAKTRVDFKNQVRAKLFQSMGPRGALQCGIVTLSGLVVLTQSGITAHSQPRLRSSAYLPFSTPDPVKYNLKWGSLRARLDGSIQVEANDNINLADQNKESDLSFAPHVGIGFVYQISSSQTLNLDTGIGYRQYLNHPSVSSLGIDPSTKMRFKFAIKDVEIEIHDSISIQTDPTSLISVSGGNAGGLIDFRRLINSSGVSFTYVPFRQLTLDVGYDFALERSLSSQFSSLDRDSHVFGAGAFYSLNKQWNLGLQGNYSLSEFLQNIQNNGNS